MFSWALGLWLAGCHSAQLAPPSEATDAPQRADVVGEARSVAEASLGKQAEVLVHGNLAMNGREQVLAVNPLSKGGAARTEKVAASQIYITRAAVLEKNGGKWSQILLCDEHLKNPDGYLGGSPAARATGWRLEFMQDPKDGLELKFTPAEGFDAANANEEKSPRQNFPTFDVRWNKSAKRYQSYDQSHERYLTEVPSLDIPQSILK